MVMQCCNKYAKLAIKQTQALTSAVVRVTEQTVGLQNINHHLLATEKNLMKAPLDPTLRKLVRQLLCKTL